MHRIWSETFNVYLKSKAEKCKPINSKLKRMNAESELYKLLRVD